MAECKVDSPRVPESSLSARQGTLTHAQSETAEYRTQDIPPELLAILLKDHTTGKNIFWATDDYSHLGEGYGYSDPITVEALTDVNGDVVIPRSQKSHQQQRQRSREMAEVFTPAWICNKQNNLVDEAWFGRKDVFNTEIENASGVFRWEPTEGNIKFPGGKTWRDYVTENRMEITCGEAPYLTSQYDAVTGEKIPVEKRIGLLDRKLRVVKENTESPGEWLAAAKAALRSTYGFEWQGDNLLIARKNLYFTFCDFYHEKFDREIPKQSLPGVAYIISWNIWQMDGLKGVIPNSCGEHQTVIQDLFGETVSVSQCRGCKDGDIRQHNGTYATIVEWPCDLNFTQVKHKKPIRFIDLIK